MAFIGLSWNVWNAGIASGYIDSVKKLGAQDEALYSREAIHMATQGGWLTPTYLDRFVLFKPPLLMWMSGASAKLLGISPFTLRLPALLAGALICVLVFSLSSRAGWAAVLLLISNRTFHTLARANMTDILLCACVMSAFYFLERAWPFGLCCGLAILAKSVAGLLPFAAALLFMLIMRGRSPKPKWSSLARAVLIAGAIALPWHAFQFFVHRQWFLAEYVGVQLLAFGVKPLQTSQENQIIFYLSRLWLSDPVLTTAAVLSVPSFFIALRRRAEIFPLLLFSWLLVFSGALLIFQYRNLQYMLPLIPALALLAARYCPLLDRRLALIGLATVFVVKAVKPDSLSGLSFAGGSTVALAAPLSSYCEQHRPNDLILIDAPDELYSSVIPLARVRYAWSDPDGGSFGIEPHLNYLGIMLRAPEFLRLDDARKVVYADRLRSWGTPSDRSIGTAVVAQSNDALRELVAARPGSDFLLPRSLVLTSALATHDVRPAALGHVFLISKNPIVGDVQALSWPCRM